MQIVERMLSKDMATISEYLQTWKLKVSTTKTVLVVFHQSEMWAESQPQQWNFTLLLRT